MNCLTKPDLRVTTSSRRCPRLATTAKASTESHGRVDSSARRRQRQSVSNDQQIGVPTGVRWVAGPTGRPVTARLHAVGRRFGPASGRRISGRGRHRKGTSKGTLADRPRRYNGLRLWRRKADSLELIRMGGGSSQRLMENWWPWTVRPGKWTHTL